MNTEYEISESTAREIISKRIEFSSIVDTLELAIRNKKLVIVKKQTKQEIGIATLKKIYILMQLGYETLPDEHYHRILLNIMLEKLSFEEAEKLESTNTKKINVISPTESTKIKEKLNSLEKDYFTNQIICEVVKEVTGKDINVMNQQLAKLLKDLGYVKKRKMIDSKKVTIWIKNN